MPKRAEFKHENADCKPEAFGSILSLGMRQSSITILPVGDARNENFPGILGVLSPSAPLSTIKPRTTPSKRAQTTHTSAMGAFVIQCFAPFRTNSPVVPSYVAFVDMPPGSPC